jgi:hypothetical protein
MMLPTIYLLVTKSWMNNGCGMILPLSCLSTHCFVIDNRREKMQYTIRRVAIDILVGLTLGVTLGALAFI